MRSHRHNQSDEMYDPVLIQIPRKMIRISKRDEHSTYHQRNRINEYQNLPQLWMESFIIQSGSETDSENRKEYRVTMFFHC